MRYFTVFLIDVDGSRQTAVSDVEIDWCATEEEMKSVEKLTQFDRSYSSGTLKPAQAKIDGQLVGASWCAQEQFDESELGVRIQLEAHQAWLFSAFVDKSMRGRGIFFHLLSFIDQSLDAQGTTQLFAAVNPVNKASMKVFRQNSTSEPASVFVIRLLSMTLCLTFGNAARDRTFTMNSRRQPIEVRIRESSAINHPPLRECRTQ